MLKSSSKSELSHLTIKQEPNVLTNISEYFKNFDLIASAIGFLIGAFIKIVLEGPKRIVLIKNIIFAVAISYFLVSFVSSDDYDIYEAFEIMNLEQLLPAGNPYYLFGFLVAYVVELIYQIIIFWKKNLSILRILKIRKNNDKYL